MLDALRAHHWKRLRSALSGETAFALLSMVCLVVIAFVVLYAFVQSVQDYMNWLDCGLRLAPRPSKLAG